MNPSSINPLNSVPLVASTQILTNSAQIPVSSSTPITQVPVATNAIPQVQSVVPTIVQDQHYTTQTTLNTLVDEDYRLGRGILDDFRPNAYRTQIGVVGNTTTNVITSSTLPINSTPVVSTPLVASTNVGANNLKDFL